MGVKQTQFSYDDEWAKRKVALGSSATWKRIMEEGIISLEKQAGKVEEEPKEEPAEDLKKEPEEKVELDVSEEKSFIIDVTDINIDLLNNNSWMPIPHPDELLINDIVRFRKDKLVQSIDGIKRFIVVELNNTENGRNYLKIKPNS